MFVNGNDIFKNISRLTPVESVLHDKVPAIPLGEKFNLLHMKLNLASVDLDSQRLF